MKFFYINWVALALAVFSMFRAHGEEFSSPITTESLTGKEFTIPKDLTETPTLIVVGFTRDSQKYLAKWSENIRIDDSLSDLNIHEAAVIEGAPRLIRGLIIRGIKKEVPEAIHEQFLLVLKGSKDLKKLVNYDDSDDPFLILLNKDHSVFWKANGKFSEAVFDELKQEIESVH